MPIQNRETFTHTRKKTEVNRAQPNAHPLSEEKNSTSRKKKKRKKKNVIADNIPSRTSVISEKASENTVIADNAQS